MATEKNLDTLALGVTDPSKTEEARQDRHLEAVIFYNTTFQMNLSVRLGKALNIVKFNVELIDSYALALERAGELLDIDFYQLPRHPWADAGERPADAGSLFSRQLDWDDFSFSVRVEYPDMVHCVASGTLRL